MLYQIGPLTLDTFPASVDEVRHRVTADFAKHSLVGRRQDYEPEGPGEEEVTLSGEILPFHIGGLSEIELAKSLTLSLSPQYVSRGDGKVLGYFVLTSVEERHKMISPTGVGFVVNHEIRLERVDDAGSDIASDLISTLLSLF